MSSLGASRHSPRRGKQELRRKQSLPLGGKVPSESEANEGRDMLSQEEGKDGEPREDSPLPSKAEALSSFPEGESENKAEQSEVNGND